MKKLSLALLLITAQLWAVGVESHTELTASSMNGAHRRHRDYYKAVALIQTHLNKKNIKLHTGFFYAPDKVLTALSVDSDRGKDACNKIFVSTGFIEKTAHEIPRQYRCVEDLAHDHTLGFRAFRVEQMDGSEARNPYFELDFKTRVSTRFRKNDFESMGYTLDRALMYSEDCEVMQTGFQPSEAVKAAKPSLVFADYAWIRGECISQMGMHGGPILRDGKVIGIASGVTRQTAVSDPYQDELVWVQMNSIGRHHELE